MPKARVHSLDLYKTIFLQSPISTQIFSATGEVIRVNKTWEKLWGITLKEIGSYNILHDRQLIQKGIMSYIKKGFSGTPTRIPATKHELSKKVKHAKGVTYRWVEAFIYPVKDPSGRVTEVILQQEDITVRKETQERQLLLERISRLLFMSLDVEQTLKKICEYLSPYVADYCRIAVVDEKVHGVSNTAPKGKSSVTRFYSNNKGTPEISDRIAYILRTGKTDLLTEVTAPEVGQTKERKTLRRLMNRAKVHSFMGIPLIARGRIVGAITFFSVRPERSFTRSDLYFAQEVALRIAIALDNASLYQQALFEIEQRKEAAKKLKQSEERYRLVFESANDLITVLDPRGRYLYTSPSHKRIMGYTSKELYATNAFLRIHPEDISAVKKEFSLALKGEIRRASYRIKHKNGKWLTIESTGSAILDEYGKPYMVVVTSHDATARIELERRKDEFLSMASHELKTPVTSLKAYAQVLQKRFMRQGDTISAFHLAKMDTQLNKLTSLIADLLDISKIQAGKLPFFFEAFSIDLLISDIAEEIQRISDDHKIMIKSVAKKDAYADRERTGQVLTNLLSNAIKYSPNADKVYIHAEADEQFITVAIEDFGVGVPPDKQKHIFERFYRVSGPKENTFPGLGLGLFICSEIIKTQGGKIWVQSHKNKGTTFSFTVPVV